MFLAFEIWCDDVLHPEDIHPWNFRTREFYDEYRTKYAIAKMIQPQSILEVGVRFGYGARSFLFAAPTASYVGLDHDEPSFGPYKGVPREWAEHRLRNIYPDNSIFTFHCDTQTNGVSKLGLQQADLIHIDADHSYRGALNDLQNFWCLAKKALVVDDYEQIADVRSAVNFFCCNCHEAILLSSSSLRGSAIIIKDT